MRKDTAFPSWYFYINYNLPLSRKMMFTLQSCRRWEILMPLLPFGPIDINGSLNGLLNRELIGIRKIGVINDSAHTWYVTDKGKCLLKQIA
ncbi:MAG: hypothetical protein ABJA57_06445 [Ginsengibacter sp.]